MDISLSGAVTNPVLNGNLRLERGYFYMDNFGERSVEDGAIGGGGRTVYAGRARPVE